jgi:hypothetical protein
MFATALAFAALWLAVPAVFYALCAILFVIVVIGMSTTDEYDNGIGFWATVGSLGLVGLVGYHNGVTWDGLKEHPILDVIGFGSYFVVGVIWSFAKWYFHLSNAREAFQTLKAAFAEKNKMTPSELSAPLSERPTAPLYPVGIDRNDPVKIEEYNVAQKEYEALLKLWEAEKSRLQAYFRRVDAQLKTYKEVVEADLLEDPAKIVDAIKPEAAKHKAAITEWIAFWPMSLTWTVLNDPVRKIVNYIFSRIKGTFQKMSDKMFAEV